MKPSQTLLVLLLAGLFSSIAFGQKKELTYKEDVAPVVKKYCLPCHSSENEDNSSELILDSYETLKEGGKHGDAVIAGKPKESNMYIKLLADPPFGRQMPRGRGPKPEENDIKLIYQWIEQGAKKE